MSSLIVTLLFDACLAVLLVITIGYCAKLSRRIRMLQDGRSELAEMINRFDTATDRAMNSLAELQAVAKKITDALQLKIEKANFLADDLAFLIEKSGKLSEKLEKAAAEPAKTPAPHLVTKPKAVEPKPLFDSQFLKSKPASEANDTVSQTKIASSLEAVLQRLASSTGPTLSSKPESSDIPPLPRTDAERELLQALKSGR